MARTLIPSGSDLVGAIAGSDALHAAANVVSKQRGPSALQDIGTLGLRVTVGGLLAGHGLQKLVTTGGWLGGRGLKGTAQFLEGMIGLKPGTPWAAASALSEFGGGTLTALGLLHPLGPIATFGAMGMATGTAHWGKPIWAGSGGAELPVTNMAAAFALALSGPGRFSLDRLLGIRVPRLVVAGEVAAVAGLLALGLATRSAPAPAPAAADRAEAGTAAHT
jgi:putative oxidoreductase